MPAPLVQIELLKSIRKRREYFLLHVGWEQPVFCNSLGLELGKKVIGGVCPTKGEEEMHGCVLQKEKRRWGVPPAKREEMGGGGVSRSLSS